MIIFLNEFSDKKISDFQKLLLKGIPLEYITGRAYFFKSEFSVNSNVLIPRSETEILVELSLQEAEKIYKNENKKRICIADIGSGSGAIIISLMREAGFPVKGLATDITSSALEICEQNYFNLGHTIPTQSTLKFIQADRLDGVVEENGEKFDIIISNPPYIKKTLGRCQVHFGVDHHEPHLALYLEDDIYDQWFENFFHQAYMSLNSGGRFIMEGHEDHLEKQSIKLKSIGFKSVKIIRDYTHRHRFLIGTFS